MICFCAHEVCNNRFRWPPPLVGYGTEHIDVFVPFQAETPDLKTSQPSQGLFFQFRWHTELCRWFAYHWFITIIYSWPFHVMYIYEQLPGSHWITISSCGCIDSSSTEEVWPLKLWYIPWNLLLLPLFLPLKRYPNFWSTKAWSPSRPVSRGSALGGYLEFQQIVSFGWNRTNVHYNHEFNEFNMNSGDLAKSVGTVFFFRVISIQCPFEHHVFPTRHPPTSWGKLQVASTYGACEVLRDHRQETNKKGVIKLLAAAWGGCCFELGKKYKNCATKSSWN